MRGLIVAWAMVGIVAGAEPDVVKSRIEAIKTAVNLEMKSITGQLTVLAGDLRKVKAAGINARIERESAEVNGRRVYRSKELREARVAKVQAEIDELSKRLAYLKAGGVSFPGLGRGAKVGSYGNIYGFEVQEILGPQEARIELAWDRISGNDGSLIGTDYETFLLRGVPTNEWADGQKVAGPMRAVECLGTDASTGRTLFVLTPIDPAPYEAALRGK